MSDATPGWTITARETAHGWVAEADCPACHCTVLGRGETREGAETRVVELVRLIAREWGG